MMIRFLFFFLFFFLLSVFQTSFLAQFSVFGFAFPLVLGSVLLVNILERQEVFSGLMAALIAGFFLDLVSASPMGFWSVLSLVLGFGAKFLLKPYARLPISQ